MRRQGGVPDPRGDAGDEQDDEHGEDKVLAGDEIGMD
jgi:hypothetical protein